MPRDFEDKDEEKGEWLFFIVGVCLAFYGMYVWIAC